VSLVLQSAQRKATKGVAASIKHGQTEDSYEKSVKIVGLGDEIRTRELNSMDANRSELEMYTETSRKAEKISG
jgi:hypothetical protein